eukprot:Tamp_25410.p1 GENE.Tamp_25410~~Tamp_25410.p1  ORF type:complete len:211 (-),score=25.57 Tamp_25410:311-892(-)
MDKESVRKAEVGWSPRGSKGEAGTVLQSGLSSAIYQSIANTAAHKIKDGPPLATKVDHEYLKPLEVWQKEPRVGVQQLHRQSFPAAEAPSQARRNGLHTDRLHRPHNSLGALFNSQASQMFAVIQGGFNQPWPAQVAPSVAPSVLTRSRLSKSFSEGLCTSRHHGAGVAKAWSGGEGGGGGGGGGRKEGRKAY